MFSWLPRFSSGEPGSGCNTTARCLSNNKKYCYLQPQIVHCLINLADRPVAVPTVKLAVTKLSLGDTHTREKLNALEDPLWLCLTWRCSTWTFLVRNPSLCIAQSHLGSRSSHTSRHTSGVAPHKLFYKYYILVWKWILQHFISEVNQYSMMPASDYSRYKHIR